MIEDEIRVHYRSIGKTIRRRRQSSCRQDCSQEMGSHPTGHLGLPIGLSRTWGMWRDRVVSQFGPTIGSPGFSSPFWSHSSFREECSFSRGETTRKQASFWHPRLWPGKIKNTWLEHLCHPGPWATIGQWCSRTRDILWALIPGKTLHSYPKTDWAGSLVLVKTIHRKPPKFEVYLPGSVLLTPAQWLPLSADFSPT